MLDNSLIFTFSLVCRLQPGQGCSVNSDCYFGQCVTRKCRINHFDINFL